MFLDRGWEYQKCTELGAYMSTPKNTSAHPFGGDFMPLELVEYYFFCIN
jgi:hypothetical protein